ncbi:transcription factor AP-1 [Thrips palmi]|uniref:Transcription factor AP-1 n=1 Tax=Thrips palmi TaxID=161013 RepID=A0A6P8ZCM5_THRPL|nr:transcription factor AP-1 [Thrips palmi]
MVRTPANNNIDTSRMDHHYLNMGGPLQQQAGQADAKKRPLFLDLNKPIAKKGRFANIGQPVLSSPDLHKLKLGSPDLEKFIMGNGTLTTATPTPNTASILFPQQPVTEEQELFAKGFAVALNVLQHSDSSQGGTHMDNMDSMDNMDGGDTRFESSSSNDSSEDFAGENSQGASYSGGYGMLKEEQRVPSLGGSSPPMSPINMESQEKIKLERKRQRNRLAASKCRKRKLERIAKLEDKVKLLKGENTDLSALVNRLKQQVCHLKEQVIEHAQHGCEIGPAQYGLQ